MLSVSFLSVLLCECRKSHTLYFHPPTNQAIHLGKLSHTHTEAVYFQNKALLVINSFTAGKVSVSNILASALLGMKRCSYSGLFSFLLGVAESQ